MNITDIQVKKIDPNAIEVFSQTQDTFLTQALSYLNKEEYAKREDKEQLAYSTVYTAYSENEKVGDKKVNQEIRYLKFDDSLRANVLKTTDLEKQKTTHYISVTELDKDNGMKKVVSFIDGELLGVSEVETNETALVIPTDFDKLSEQEMDVNQEEITLQGLPCISDGCCSFRYNGNPFNPLVNYKWCGANCGSGTPVNELDRCCMYHDRCYGNNGGYPGRCGCDRVLIACAQQTDNAGTDRLISAFVAKMAAMGC